MFSREDILRAIDSPCFGYLYAVNVANITPILVSSSIRSFYNIVEANFTKPQSDAELCLEVRHGICGNHAATAIALFERAGFKARAVEFYYEYEGKRQNHIIPEVLIDGCWRLIESTYGGYWVSTKEGNFFELMCTDSILAGNSYEFIYNNALLPYSIKKKYNYLSYLNTSSNIIRGGIGDILISLKYKNGTENFKDIPNYVGDNKYDDIFDGIKFKINSEEYKYKLIVSIIGSAFSNNSEAYLCINKSCEKIEKNKDIYHFEVENP